MEAWATVALVLGSNAIMGLVNWFATRMQIKNSENQIEKRLQAQREADKRERRREVRSEPLLKLRSELARMAAKGEKVASMVMAMPFGATSKDPPEKFKEAMGDWNTYMGGGEFQQVLFMQYDFVIVNKVNAIKLEYENARHYLWEYWNSWGDADKEKESEEALNVVERNRSKIAEVQSEINKLLEEL